ncbi:ABC transporter ATP-binding protein [Halobacteriales archaeon QH_2_65_14]|nr:MAG: ABC transporter ATP-binding protein [Halobacteriales archaeon QH_2_65_14]
MRAVVSDPAVELDGVTKRYETTTAVADLSFAVSEGEFFTLVGPSGCGKTTTLRLLGGFESPTAGSIRLHGVDVADVPPEDRHVGVVFQNYALFPHMTVGENVAYGLKFSSPPGDVTGEERVADLLELVDLGGMEERNPRELSGGQKQRVAMARALAPGPDVLLLDETHDQEEALAISDRVAVMHDGRIDQVGTPRDVYPRPETRFVAEFVGDNNVLSGTVTAMRTDGGGGRVADVDLGPTTVAVRVDGNPAVSTGETLVFCVRPEHLTVDGTTNQLVTTVGSVEFLGGTTRVHLDWNGRELLARTRTALDGTVTVGFDPADAHVVG